jgi:hypothetical protein
VNEQSSKIVTLLALQAIWHLDPPRARIKGQSSVLCGDQ